jgi:hypothetical protein
MMQNKCVGEGIVVSGSNAKYSGEDSVKRIFDEKGCISSLSLLFLLQ